MKIVGLTPAETVVVDAQSGRTSIINVFETISAEAIPFVVPKLTVLSIIAFDDLDSREPLYLRIRNGNLIINENALGVRGTGFRYIKNVTTFSNLVISGVEDVVITLECGSSVITSYRIAVMAKNYSNYRISSSDKTMMGNAHSTNQPKVTVN